MPRVAYHVWQRIRTRHDSYQTECSDADGVRRFLTYAAERQAGPNPQVDAESIRDVLTHLAVHQRVAASTQNQALCAILIRQIQGSLSPRVRRERWLRRIAANASCSQPMPSGHDRPTTPNPFAFPWITGSRTGGSRRWLQARRS
jgi:hypothetical protein